MSGRLAVLAGLLVTVGVTPPAHAAEIDVPCSPAALIAAMDSANATLAPDTLRLAAGCTYQLDAVDNGMADPNGLPEVDTEIEITGNGATIARAETAADEFRILSVTSGGSLSLSELTVSGGESPSDGGGLRNRGGTVDIIASTFTGNEAANGGAIHNDAGGIVTAVNSTIAANTAHPGNGGGISNAGEMSLTHATVAFNHSTDQAGNVENVSPGVLEFTNSIVAQPTGGDNCLGDVTDGGRNLTWPAVDPTCPDGFDRAWPGISQLEDNGGPTHTSRPADGSAAIDAVPAIGGGCEDTDQRGTVRYGGTACDIGAYEVAKPKVHTGPATDVSTDAATVAGTVENRLPTPARVQFFVNADGVFKPPVVLTVGHAPNGTSVSARVTGLTPGTTYTYRLIADNWDGYGEGASGTFTTSAGPAPTPDPDPPAVTCAGWRASIVVAAGLSVRGTAGADVIAGTEAPDQIAGRGGSDRICAGGGQDRVSGGQGADFVSGGTGNDRISAGSGRDRVRGGPGSDRIAAADGQRDTIRCGRGRDRVTADRRDRLTGCERVRRR